MSALQLSLQMLWICLGSAVLGGLIVLVVTRLLSRREGNAAVREVIRAIEDLGAGGSERLPQLEEGEPLSGVIDALAGLAEVTRRRGAEEERRIAALRGVLDSARGIGFIGTDAAGDVTLWSEGARELLGFTTEEVRGRALSRLFVEESWEQLSPRLSRRDLREGGLLHERARMRRRGGGELSVFLSVAPADDWEARGLLYSFRDSSEAESLQRELRESEEKFRCLVETQREGTFLCESGRIVYANRAMEALLGVSAEELSGKALLDCASSEDILRMRAQLQKAESRASLEPFECRLRSPASGTRGSTMESIPVRLTLSAIRLGGKPAVVGSVQDVGELSRSSRRIQASERRLDATLEATSDGILMLAGPPGRQKVTIANRRLAELLGVSPRAAFRLPGGELARALGASLREPERFRRAFEALSASGAAPGSDSFEQAGPPERVIEMSAAPAFDSDGRLLGRVFAFRDMTGLASMSRAKEALERVNASLAEVNTRLQQRTGELDRLNQELRSLGEMKSTLLANVSHELQTPLVSIKGYTELILKGKLGSVNTEQRRGLEVSLRNIDRLIGMIDNLLAMAQSERRIPEMKVESFPLPELVEECVELLRAEADRKHLAVTTRYPAEAPTVKGDREKIAQVFVNLIGNAIKFNREGGDVSIAVRRGGEGLLVVDVRDTGIGIPGDSLERIFDRFYRAEETAADAPAGMGLGLAIVRDILGLHGCTIRAESRVGEGSVFTFTLPQPGAGEGTYRQALHAEVKPATAPGEQEAAGGGRRLEIDRAGDAADDVKSP